MSWYLSVMVRRTEPLNVLRKNRPGIRRVRGAEFSLEFRKGSGIFAGLELTTGDAVIVMDCDLQHPPEVIPQMWEKWQQGARSWKVSRPTAVRRVWDISCLPDFLQDHEQTDQDGHECFFRFQTSGQKSSTGPVGTAGTQIPFSGR